MQIKRGSDGQGCDRGDGSRTSDGKWAKCRGVDRDSSNERTKVMTPEYLNLLHQSFWKVLVNDRI